MRFDKETKQRFEARLGRGQLTLNGQRSLRRKAAISDRWKAVSATNTFRKVSL